MFDLSFAELLVIGVVALVVLGPERLPKAARFVGVWVRRARGQWQSVKSELERELAAEELKRDLDHARSAVRDAQGRMREADAQARRETGGLRDHLQATVRAATGGGAATPPPPDSGLGTHAHDPQHASTTGASPGHTPSEDAPSPGTPQTTAPPPVAPSPPAEAATTPTTGTPPPSDAAHDPGADVTHAPQAEAGTDGPRR